MACAAMATTVTAAAALAPGQVWESRTLSRQGLVMAAPVSRKMVANRSRVVMRYIRLWF